MGHSKFCYLLMLSGKLEYFNKESLQVSRDLSEGWDYGTLQKTTLLIPRTTLVKNLHFRRQKVVRASASQVDLGFIP